MKALVINKDLSREIKEVADPVMMDCLAKVKVLGCGLCGSDVKILKGKLKNTPLDIYPMIPGHEAVGRVVELGKDVTSYKVGDIVLMPYNLITSDGLGAAWGAMAEYATVIDPAAPGAEMFGIWGARCQAKILPEWMDPLEAVMVITLRETLGAIGHFGLDANEAIAIYGCGPVGFSFIQFCKVKGLGPIIALDLDESKRELALQCGANHFVNAGDPQRLEKIRAICPEGLDNVLDAVGVSDVYNDAMQIMKEDGKISAYGVPSNQEMELVWRTNPQYNWKLDFYQMSDKKHEYWAHNQVMFLVEKGIIKLSDYISDYFTFDEILGVLDRFENREFKKKVIITFPN